MKLVKNINRETLNKHRKMVEGFIADMTDDELTEAWHVVTELGTIISDETHKRSMQPQ